jgi:hypothetical protein
MLKHEKQPEPMNKEADVIVKANSFVNPLFAKAGVLISGDLGLEFRADSGRGFIQIPWSSLTLVRVDLYGQHVRGIEVQTDTSSPLSFTLMDGARLLRSIRDHIGRDKMTTTPHALSSLLRHHAHRGKGETKGDDALETSPSADEAGTARTDDSKD